MFTRLVLLGLGFCAAAASAAPITVGSGPDSVQVLLNWPDGFVADYAVKFGTNSSSTIGGYDATQAALADSNLSLQWDNEPFGGVDPNYFLNVATYTGGHVGDGATFDFNTAPENFWHEWIDAGNGWTFGNGASVDVLSDGERIGWVFGSASTPVPEPVSSIAFVGFAIMLARWGRRSGMSRWRQVAKAAQPLPRASSGMNCALLFAFAAVSIAASARAADSVTVVPGSLSQGAVKASLGPGTTYAQETNNLGDWPLTTGGSGSAVTAISITNSNFNGTAFGGTPNSIIAFGDGGGVTLKFASPVHANAGEKDIGIFTAQDYAAGSGGQFNGNMEAAILVSADNVNWRTLSGAIVADPTIYTATSNPLNAPTVAYDFGTTAAAWSDGSPGTTQASLAALPIADFTTPMPNDNLFNGSGTNSDRLALAGDNTVATYSAIFGASGGGNWFDVSGSGLSQINYIRLNGVNVPGTGGVRLDAVFANAAAVPEPSSAALFLFPLIASSFLVRKRQPACGRGVRWDSLR